MNQSQTFSTHWWYISSSMSSDLVAKPQDFVHLHIYLLYFTAWDNVLHPTNEKEIIEMVKTFKEKHPKINLILTWNE